MERPHLSLVGDAGGHVYQPQDRLKNLTIIASGKGGVGKTWFSIHLAHALGLMQRESLLIDGDFGLANVDVQLGLMPTVDLSQVLKGYANIDECLITEGPGKFHLLPGQSGMSDLSAMSPSQIALFKTLLVQKSQSYENVLLDLGAGIGNMVMSFVPMAAQVIVVITPDPTSLTDAYAFIKVVRQNYPYVALHVVVNQAKTTQEGHKIFETLSQACEKFLNFRLHNLGFIPKEGEVIKAIRHQKLLPKVAPGSPAWRKIQDISRTLFCQKRYQKVV